MYTYTCIQIYTDTHAYIIVSHATFPPPRLPFNPTIRSFTFIGWIFWAWQVEWALEAWIFTWTFLNLTSKRHVPPGLIAGLVKGNQWLINYRHTTRWIWFWHHRISLRQKVSGCRASSQKAQVGEGLLHIWFPDCQEWSYTKTRFPSTSSWLTSHPSSKEGSLNNLCKEPAFEPLHLDLFQRLFFLILEQSPFKSSIFMHVSFLLVEENPIRVSHSALILPWETCCCRPTPPDVGWVSMVMLTGFLGRRAEVPKRLGIKQWAYCTYVWSGLNSHDFHMIWDGHQPISRGSNTQYKDSVRRVGMTILNIRSLDPRTYNHIWLWNICTYFFSPEQTGTTEILNWIRSS